MSLVEDDAPESAALIGRIFGHTGRAYFVGVTGAPGAGKSTLVDRLTTLIRSGGQTVGVVAVDPTSPFTGGAILGDRVRMMAHTGDDGVFIRSMATRGHLGGLARATSDVALILDAAGSDIVIIETVGVGQDEIEIVRAADVSVVVLVPGTGDDVQAIKAGIMEIADIFVVNKADREGADRAVDAVAVSLSLQAFEPEQWRPPILKTDAVAGVGIDELWASIRRFRDETAPQRISRGRERIISRLEELLTERCRAHVREVLLRPGEFDALVDAVVARRTDPYSAVAEVMHRTMGMDARPAETGTGTEQP